MKKKEEFISLYYRIMRMSMWERVYFTPTPCQRHFHLLSDWAPEYDL